MRPAGVALVAVLCACLGTPATALADVHVGAGQTVRELKAVGQDVRVDGTVTENALVIGGDLTIGPHGHVSTPIVIAGQLRTSPGARVSGDVTQFSGLGSDPSPWQVILACALLLALRTGAVWVLVSLALMLARDGPLTRLGALARERPLRTLLAGALASWGLAAAGVLLIISILGIPVALLIAAAFFMATALGIALALQSTADWPQATRLTRIALWIPVLGDALAALLAALGFGTALRAIGTTRPAHTHSTTHLTH